MMLYKTRFVTNSHCCCKTNRLNEEKTTPSIVIYRKRERKKSGEKKKNVDESTQGYIFFPPFLLRSRVSACERKERARNYGIYRCLPMYMMRQTNIGLKKENREEI